MKFTSRADIAAPAAEVFAQVADLTVFAPEARRGGLDLRRTDALAGPGEGMAWDIGFRFRGRARQLALRVARFVPPEQIEYEGESSSFETSAVMQVIALARSRSRLQVVFTLRPRTLGARLLLQSARLGRARLESRLDARVALFAEAVGARIAS